MIHRALNGNLRAHAWHPYRALCREFPGVAGAEQVRWATVNDDKVVLDRAYQMRDTLKAAGLRVTLDDSAESVGKKIRAARPGEGAYTWVVGEQEAKGEPVSSARIPAGDLGSIEAKLTFDAFVDKLKREVADRAAKSSL